MLMLNLANKDCKLQRTKRANKVFLYNHVL